MGNACVNGGCGMDLWLGEGPGWGGLFGSTSLNHGKLPWWLSWQRICLQGWRLLAVQEMQVRCLGQEDPLEKKMKTHSSILAWEVLWTEEPGRLQSTES